MSDVWAITDDQKLGTLTHQGLHGVSLFVLVASLTQWLSDQRQTDLPQRLTQIGPELGVTANTENPDLRCARNRLLQDGSALYEKG